jgi:hypothetical protein
MARRNRNKHQRPRRAPATAETRSAETLTVLWMLTAAMALVCGMSAGAAFLGAYYAPHLEWVRLLAGVLLFAATVFGTIDLALVYFVLRVRRVTPPRGIVACAVAVGAAPVTAYILLLVAKRG